ncbi:Fungal trans multi-domain protein [Pyrenophora teres f. maculata]|nr:Fungal trans multi-domain protein [Pyrenophora teres f. maculata]
MAGVPSRQLTTQEYAGDMNNFSPRKQQPQQQRQLLSCTKCRARKVKCDRTKPCSACCVRGSPRDCHFITEDGNYTPIRQSYELRKLRAENLRLKQRLNSLRISVDGEDLEYAQAVDSQSGEKLPSWHKRKQQSFQTLESRDSIYFGSPGLTTVINEFASTNTSISTTLAHVMPHPVDVFVMGNPSTYPFATIFSASLEECIPQLLGCLPVKDNMLRYLSTFEHQVGAQIPVAITKFEVERFLSHAKENSQRCPTMLGLLLAVIALGAQHSVWGRNGESWDADVMRAETRAGNVYIAAAMQALRLASFMHKPSLLAIQVLVMIGKYLINSGKYLDAFTLFGTTIRLAHSIGLHCHPKYLEPSPPTARDVATRQRIWWYMLRVDEEFSMTLGRPLGISGIGTCCWPQELTTDPNIVRFGEYINHFTLLARQILSSDRLTNPRIDEFTDALRTLSETLPETLRFDNSWANSKIDLHLGSWPLSVMATVYYCKMNTYLILLNRQRVEKQAHSSATFNNIGTMSAFTAVNHTPSILIASSEDIISAFLFFHRREPSALVDWTIGQQAFNSCMILLLDAIERRTITYGSSKAEEALHVFKILKSNHVHIFAGRAVDKIEKGFKELHDTITQTNDPDYQARLQQWNNKVISGTRQDKAMLGSGGVQTVMGRTGMLLIEGADLQAFVKEEFSPTSWDMPSTWLHSVKIVYRQSGIP